ncbi:MAG TPA: TonB-dependent receptor [Rhodothermales bacterium]|nr:TonB-dependent receptor [Rhodothermales bacterium]
MTRLSSAFALAALTLAVLAVAARAQPDTTAVHHLGAIEVVASPFTLVPGRAPLALAVRGRGTAEQATDPAVALDALGRGVPGLWISDRGNPSTGERVLVRGLGWRAAFGVRGTHIVLDGISLTLADGQGQLNVVEPAFVERVEVVRGPASTFWGSGSAGVVALSTATSPGPARVRLLGGAYGLAKAEVSVRPDLGEGRRLALWGSALTQDGFREHGAQRAFRGGLSASTALGTGSLDVVALGAAVPVAESPGGITLDEAAADPRQTRAVAIEQNTGKSLAQGHLALTVRQRTAGVRYAVTIQGGARSLDNPIIPRYITLGRLSGGLRATVEGGERVAWGVGVESELQRDDRLERTNEGGEPGPDILTDQVETVVANAAFGRLAVPVGALTLTASGRVDVLRYSVDPSARSGQTVVGGGRTVAAISPSVGVAYALPVATLYANAAGALDAPTTVELGNRLDGQPGFNPDLRPERTWGVEAGGRAARGVGDGAVWVDVAAFVAWARDLLLPFEVDDVTAYRNEGAARHAGIEAAVTAEAVRLGPGRLAGAVAVTLARGTFTNGPDGSETPEGNVVPGFPDRLATWTLTWSGRGLVLGLDGEAASSTAADSAGEQVADGYAVTQVRLGLEGVRLGSAEITPFVTVRNVGDARYAGAVIVNAFGGRFVEPASGRHIVVGVSVTLP